MKINIGDKTYFIAKPVFIILDALKTETGIDFALGMDEVKSRNAMSDMKKLPKIISYLTCEKEDEKFDEDAAKKREEYFYRNAEMSDFAKVMGFFSLRLSGKENDSPGQQIIPEKSKSKMKLVKTK